jgi:butyrate kinase
MMNPRILVINPGSTSTKVSLFEGDQEIFSETIQHKVEELSRFNKASDQDLYRMELILRSLQKNKVEIGKIAAIVGRGGL